MELKLKINFYGEKQRKILIYLPNLFKNSLIVLFEASKKFLGRPLYGPSYRFEENNNGLPIIYSVKLDENTHSTFTIWLNLDGFVEYINSEYNKNFKDGQN